MSIGYTTINPDKVKRAYTNPFFKSTELIRPVTSQSPEVKKWGVSESAGLNSAMWLYPSGVGTTSKYAVAPDKAKFSVLSNGNMD